MACTWARRRGHRGSPPQDAGKDRGRFVLRDPALAERCSGRRPDYVATAAFSLADQPHARRAEPASSGKRRGARAPSGGGRSAASRRQRARLIEAGADLLAVHLRRIRCRRRERAARSFARLFEGAHSGGMEYERSRALFESSLERIPGGVNSPVRAFGAVAERRVLPRGARRAPHREEAASTWTMWAPGPAHLGHAHPQVIEAGPRGGRARPVLRRAHALELEMAELLTTRVPSIGGCAWWSSGTERDARAAPGARFTGRSVMREIRRAGYPGHSDPCW